MPPHELSKTPVATSIDIDRLPTVVNFELPFVSEDYVHRIGRTARAGQEGNAISLVCIDELKLLDDIENLLKTKIRKEVIPGYEPDKRIKAEPIKQGGGNRAANNRNKKPRNRRGNAAKKSGGGRRTQRQRRAG